MTQGPEQTSPGASALPPPPEAVGAPLVQMNEVISAEMQGFAKKIAEQLNAEVLAGAELGPMLLTPMSPFAALNLYNQTLVRRMNLAIGMSEELARLWSSVGVALQSGYGGWAALWPPRLA